MRSPVLFAAVVAIAAGLHVTDLPDPLEGKQLMGSRAVSGSFNASLLDPDMQLMGSHAESALDPELTNTLGEVFHVTVEGVWTFIGLPRGGDYTELLINATIWKPDTADPCDDNAIRKVTVMGSRLDPSIAKLEFYAGPVATPLAVGGELINDTFNDPSALGLSITLADGTYLPGVTANEFVKLVPDCTIKKPAKTPTPPTKNTYRKRTMVFDAVCKLNHGLRPFDPPSEIRLSWDAKWMGHLGGTPIYRNDMCVFVTGIGDNPAGLLGPDDPWRSTVNAYGCSKKQPVNGPFQVRSKPQSS